MKQVLEEVDEVKDTTEKTSKKVEKGLNKTQGKHIWLIFLFEENHWVNNQENLGHVADLPAELACESWIGFWF